LIKNKKFIIAIIIGLATCITSVYFLFQYAATHQQMTSIVVPKTNIEAYEQITEDMVGIKSVPIGSTDKSIAAAPSQVLGKTTTVPLYPGEQIRLERLAEKMISDVNKHQVAVNINLTRSVAGNLEVGNLVDVYWVSDTLLPSSPIARDCVVLKITDGQGLPVKIREKQSSIPEIEETKSLPAVVVLAVNPSEIPQLVRGSADISKEIVLVKKLKAGGNVNVAPVTEPAETGQNAQTPNSNPAPQQTPQN
jgi:Flp pilus assembly protein CpaB